MPQRLLFLIASFGQNTVVKFSSFSRPCRVLIFIGFLAIAILGTLFAQNLAANNQNHPDPNFNKSEFSIDDPKSPWVIVNKNRPLPAGYVPPDLVVPRVKLQLSPKSERMHMRAIAAGPLQALFKAAETDGFHLILLSGYRSEAYQKKIYERYLQKLKTRATIASAKPGYSEHQTGLAVDVNRDKDLKCLAMPCFAAMPEAKWLAQHAHEFGFIIRYEKGKEEITGYEYEPWHLRYVGKELATELFNRKETMEEFFGVVTARPSSQNSQSAK